MIRHTRKQAPATTAPLAAVLMLAFFFLPLGIVAQTITMPSSGTSVYTLEPGTSRTVLDPGGNNNYPSDCDASVTLVSAYGTPITLTCSSYYTEYGYDFIMVYDGSSTSSELVGSYSGVGTFTIIAYQGAVTIRLFSDQHVEHSGFSLTASVCDTVSNIPYGMEVTNVAQNAVTLTWLDSSDASSWTIRYGTSKNALNQVVNATTKTVTLTGLSTHTRYYYRVLNSNTTSNNVCGSFLNTFQTLCPQSQTGCINYSDLTSCYVTATYGSFSNPLQNTGVVNNGSSSAQSRHTVHTSTTERDSRTNNQLYTVPPGYSESVRLGNWNSGGEAESITYEYQVDTLVSDLLILKYAAVLQDPNHSVVQQPRFTFKILDRDGNEINSSCYSANFVASSTLGWNTVGEWWEMNRVLWKDWTTVGVDLTPLHGTTIYIRLTSYDCSRNNHYGYAYFVLDCSTKTLTADNCGNQVENTFTAPSGFNYRWYNADNPSATLATTQSLHVTQAGEYHCSMQFVDAPAGANCSFELKAIAGGRYPTALFTFDSVDTLNCNTVIALHNNSVISNDPEHLQLTAQPCEEIVWYVDGDSVSADNNTTVELTPGDHTLRLVASLSNRTCTDTLEQSITIYNPCLRFDTIDSAICYGDTLTVFDSALTATGTYVLVQGYNTSTVHLTVNPVDTTVITQSVLENNLPLLFADISFDSDVADTLILLSNRYNCDSSIHFSLNVLRNIHTTIDTTVCDNQLPFLFNDKPLNASGIIIDTIANATVDGADSIIVVNVTVLQTSSFTHHDTIVENLLPYTSYGLNLTRQAFIDSMQTNDSRPLQLCDSIWTIANSQGCDSTIHLSLHVWPNISNDADSTVCEGSLPLLWNGTAFNTDSTASATLTAHGLHGEDSTVNMTVTVKHNSGLSRYDTIVENTLPLTWNGILINDDRLTLLSEEASQFDTSWTELNHAGCDSLVHYSLFVWNNYSHTVEHSICDDSLPYDWNGVTFTQAGGKLQTLTSIHGTDSTLNLILTVFPTYEIFDSVRLCEGEAEPHGYSATGDYDLPLQSADGCDSLIHLHVDVFPTYDNHYHDTICDNQSSTFAGQTYSTTGDYSIPLTTGKGCDSLVTLHLTVYPTDRSYDRAVVCDGVPYTWIDGVTYTSSTYDPKIVYSNIHGCDSVLHLILDLNRNFEAKMEINPAMVSFEKPKVSLRDISGGRRREWFFDGESDTSRICNFNFPLDGVSDTLQVLLVAQSTTGCIDSAWGIVRCDRSILWAPNVFTPDENQNRLFFIPSHELASGEVWIYNRAGLLVAHFDALTGSWDGTHNGKPCPQASYVWKMSYTTKAQPRLTRSAKGTVTLLR